MKKKILCVLILVLAIVILYSTTVFAADVEVTLSDENITVDGEKISENVEDAIYLSENMNNGGTSQEALDANIEVKNVINIRESGTYKFTGTLTDGQIAVDSNNIKGEVIIILDNASITCENAPGIFVYNKDINSEDCTVIIKTAKDTENYVYGGLIKQSVEGWEDQDSLVYSVEKSYNDEGEYFERYKYDGGISADISLTFEGEGSLTIESEREGIEVKHDITINSGNYIINSTEDGMNAAQDDESVITINGGTIFVNTSLDGPQGDGIDSNGYIYINGGEIYSFANPTTEDCGIDSDLGIYINGGQIIATGNMYDEIKEDSKQNVVSLQFNESVEENTLITLVDEENNPVVAFKTSRTYKVITFSISSLEDKEYTVYEDGEIEGTEVNGLYTNITSFSGGTKSDASFVTSGMNGMKDMNIDAMNFNQRQSQSINWTIIIVLALIGVVCLIASIICIKKNKNEIIILLLGIVIGVVVVIIGVTIYNSNSSNINDFSNNRPVQEMKKMMKT